MSSLLFFFQIFFFIHNYVHGILTSKEGKRATKQNQVDTEVFGKYPNNVSTWNYVANSRMHIWWCLREGKSRVKPMGHDYQIYPILPNLRQTRNCIKEQQSIDEGESTIWGINGKNNNTRLTSMSGVAFPTLSMDPYPYSWTLVTHHQGQNIKSRSCYYVNGGGHP